MLEATLFLLSLGLGAGVVLAVASRVFYVYEDPRILAITDALPGANCGGCGYAGCGAAAEAVAKGEATANVCVIGGTDTARAVAALTGQVVVEREPKVAWTSCTYGVGEADPLFTYDGASDCRAAVLLYGGSKVCPIGCVGLGTCVKVCDFDAVHLGDNHLPIFDPRKCVACGACVRACPKHIISLTSATERVIDEYTVDECTAPCQRTCPTGIDIPAYIRAVREGRYEDGLRIIKERCPLPLICGRICPAPCELDCRRNFVDEPVGINPLKRFLADYERLTGRHVQPYKCPDSGHRVAVVGGGAEGLTAAYYLARLGHRPTIIESQAELGGILRYVISRDRLPSDVLAHDIKGVLDMGVEARCGQRLGQDYSLATLLAEGHDLAVLCTGGYDSRKLLPGDPRSTDSVAGLMLMIDLLAADIAVRTTPLGQQVVIVDGLGSALALAQQCRAAGTDRVRIVCARPLALWPDDLQDAAALAAQGISVHPECVVAAFGGEGDRLTTLVLEEVGADDPGRPRREQFAVDTVVLGAGRLPELVFQRLDAAAAAAAGSDGRLLWQTVETFRTLPFGGDNGVFSSPEPGRISDAAAVVKAMLSGRRLVRGLQQYLETGQVARLPYAVAEAASVLDVDGVVGVPAVPRNGPAAVATSGNSSWQARQEIPGLDEDGARREAARCLACGLICYQKEAVEQHA
ncbi:MAG: FAD-dependent oxidoreductase [Kiritimatiellae bacterium]|nr:FAD-dependent oxidoreductase [Kiritimatiellia bacterium]